jgi:hypothetical protein
VFDGGVDPLVWWVDTSVDPASAVWQPATGIGGGLAGVSIANGFTKDDYVAIFNQLKAYSTTDALTYTQGAGDAPSQIRHVIHELGLLSVYLAAASGGLAKSLDHGDTWGYIRPNVPAGTTWPGGADGQQVDMYPGTAGLPLPCPHIYSLARIPGGGAGRQLVRLSNGAWSVVEASRASTSFGLRYFGTGHFLAMRDGGLPQISSDYGTSWADGGFPAGGAHTYNHLHDCQLSSDGLRVWGAWHASTLGDQNMIAYSDDFGATWHMSLEVTTLSSWVTTIACHPTNKDRVAAVGILGLSGPAAWVCVNASGASPTWTQHVFAPGIDNGIIYPPNSAAFLTGRVIWTPYSRILWSLGTRGSHNTGDLYYSDDLGASWTQSTVTAPSPNVGGSAHLFRILIFGPFFALWVDETGAATALLRSDNYGISWVEVTTPDTSELWGGLEYDPITNSLLLSAAGKVWSLTPASSNPLTTDWVDVTANFYSISAGQQIEQPLAYVYDVPSNVTP